MQVKLTIGERLKDLRVERKLTLEQLSAEVGISKSALGKYESDNGKDISPYSILLLADYYGVSCDYLMGRTETKNHPNTALHELHLSDASIDVLKNGQVQPPAAVGADLPQGFPAASCWMRKFTLTGSQICGSTI